MKPGLALRSVFTSNAISFRENRVFKQHVLVYLNKAETYNIPQVNMEVISWLGAYFVKNELYEKAMAFFERAAQIQPQEVKWKLMVASCHRRIQNFSNALQIYQDIHREYPDNVECLRYLVRRGAWARVTNVATWHSNLLGASGMC